MDTKDVRAMGSGIRNSISLKLLAIVILVVLLSIPTLMVSSLINERSMRQEQTMLEVSSAWAAPQSLVGPLLAVPYVRKNTTSGVESHEVWYGVPQELKVDGNVETQIRSRGIYDVPVYSGSLQITGSFPSQYAIPSDIRELLRWGDAYIVVGVSDMRGVAEAVSVNWNGRNIVLNPGTQSEVIATGMHAPVPIDASKINDGSSGELATFSMDLNLRGSSSLLIWPIAKKTQVHITSDWAHPSFVGDFLPETHTITASGFEAAWQVLDLNRNLPSTWTSEQAIELSDYVNGPRTVGPYIETVEGQSALFGVDFYVPVDIYQQAERSAKYGVAVITLVFTMIFFAEVTSRRKIHPVQYGLVGFALVVFYTLLLSLSEHIGFGWAYLVASIAIVAMISSFCLSIMRSKSKALQIGGLLSVWYLFVYVLLRLQDFALLLGSVALFVILGIIMYVSRKIEWYAQE